MDLRIQKLLRKGQNNIGEAEEDRISELPDSLLHFILSFLKFKYAARTCVLSKRWNYIWTSIPTLKFPFWYLNEPTPSLSTISKFMDFVDRTLYFHEDSIQKFNLHANKHFDASRLHSWISRITRCNVQEITLDLDLQKPFFIPLSLFTCRSLIRLDLHITNTTTQLPKSFSFPKLKILLLYGIQFTDDSSWNEQHFSNCPVLEKLILEDCTWFGVRNFCVSTPTLKRLDIWDTAFTDDDLRNCVLKIHAPNLVSLTYWGAVAKEYVFSGFQTLESASVCLREYGELREQQIGYGAAVSNFFRALSHVESLTLYSSTLKTMSIMDDLANILPTFHDLKELMLNPGEATDKSLFPLLKAVPNLRWLVFEEGFADDNIEEEHTWTCHMLTAGCTFQHLESVYFGQFSGNARQMRWAKLILKNAKDLKTITLSLSSDDATKKVLMTELLSLPKASDKCEFEFEK